MSWENSASCVDTRRRVSTQLEGCSIYVLIDAFGWDLLRNRSFLDDIVVNRCRLETVLGYSSAAIPSILSGRLPAEHGHWNLFHLAPETSPFRWMRMLSPLPEAWVENRVSRKIIKEVARRVSGYSGYFSLYAFPISRLPFFDICERRDIYQPGGLEACPSLFDVFRQYDIVYECFTYHQFTDEQICAAVPERIRASSARVYFLYLSQMDSYLHFHIHDQDGVEAKILWYENGLRKIYRAATDRWGEVRFFLCSDHGMTPVHRTYDLSQEVNSIGLKTPAEFLPAYDSTMARFWVWTERAREQLLNLLDNHPEGRLLPDDELRHLGVWFEDARYGHLVFLMNGGTTITPSDMGRIRFAGMHGFHPSEPTADAAFLSSVALTESPRHIVDVYRVILNDLGISG